MKKPDLSKAALQKFFLYHSEKLILFVSLILLGLFFWMGFKSPVFTKTTPDQLEKMAETADRQMRDVGSWDKIKVFRKGNDPARVIKEESSILKPGEYNIDPFTGAVCKKAATRSDPTVFPVIEPHAVTFKAPLIVAMGGPIKNNLFAEFPSPPSSGLGFEVQGRGFDEEKYMEEYDEEEFSGGRFGVGREEEPEEDVLPEMGVIGSEMRGVHVHEAQGMRPPRFQISSTNSKSYIYDVVCVTGLVDFKQQWNSFEKSFSSSIGYYPDRDKPMYQHLQVERREVDAQGNPVKGENGEWSDQSEMILHKVPRRYPEMHQMPIAMYSSAPDIVAPDNYDPVLTGPIPPVVMFDYLPFVNHPKLADKPREFPEFEAEEELIDQGPARIFEDPEEGEAGFGSGFSGRPGRQGIGSAMGRGRGMDRGSSRGPTGFGSATMEEKAVATRNGSDVTDYWNALDAKAPAEDYRLVRFFDVLAKPGRTYEYRIRVWIGDANNEDLQGTFIQLQSALAGRSTGYSGMDDFRDEENYPSMENEFDASDFNPRPATGEIELETEKVYVKIPILSQMTDPSVRIRLNGAREVEDPKTRVISYFVSEPRGKDAEGKDIVEEVAVPIERPYLRFARPSAWSQPVSVTVRNRNSQVAAGAVEPPKTARLKVGDVDRYFPVTEPMSEVVASVWSNELGTAMPTRQKVYRGDALDFNAPTYVMHPITWQVLIAKNTSKTAEGGAKFLFDINTGNVVVDAMGGGELPLPRTEKMRHALPSEVLVMDELGEFHVQNDLTDKTVYRNLLFLPDESQMVGRVKEPKKKKEEEMDDRFERGERDF